MTYSYNAAIFGALFHDIGKFIQKTENDLRIEFQGSEECCPVKNNHPTHVHVKFTDGFFTIIKQNNHFQQIEREFDLKNIYDATWHHKPSDDSPIQWLIAKADWYSS